MINLLKIGNVVFFYSYDSCTNFSFFEITFPRYNLLPVIVFLFSFGEILGRPKSFLEPIFIFTSIKDGPLFSINFLSTYAVSGSIENNIHFISFIKTIVTVVITSGILFQLPLIIYALTKFELITPDKIRQYRRHSFVIILILASILTPPDIFSQILIGLPIFLLYEISVVISSISIKKYDSSSK